MCEIRPDGGIHNGNATDRPDDGGPGMHICHYGCSCSKPKAPPIDETKDIVRIRLVEIAGSDDQVDVRIDFVRLVNAEQGLGLLGATIAGLVQAAHKVGAGMGMSADEVNETLFGEDEEDLQVDMYNDEDDIDDADEELHRP